MSYRTPFCVGRSGAWSCLPPRKCRSTRAMASSRDITPVKRTIRLPRSTSIGAELLSSRSAFGSRITDTRSASGTRPERSGNPPSPPKSSPHPCEWMAPPDCRRRAIGQAASCVGHRTIPWTRARITCLTSRRSSAAPRLWIRTLPRAEIMAACPASNPLELSDDTRCTQWLCRSCCS